ncbi:MAG TPA: RsmB/NOP family class I SAM-dependent RNA methyltransferase [Daejeonella sp.]|nr:RsmB/NOP family class I SAM-dependent RNA methyltransferase [Daejeonella sp.]
MREEQQLRSFLNILEAYPANTPLNKFLPVFFKKNRQMGSTDRRRASAFLYNYFRLGQALKDKPAAERLFIAQFLCSTTENDFLQHFRPDLNAKVQIPLQDKIALLEPEGFRLADVFPFSEHLSHGMDAEEFLRSFFIQPDLFIRIHPDKEKIVKARLNEAEIPFQEIEPQTLAMVNGTKLDQVFDAQHFPFEVQDLSSQQTGQYFKPKPYENWWDACAASGGKSLLLYSLEPFIKLLVSDIRESVLNNLDSRFIGAGLRTYQKKVLDLTQNADPFLHHYQFDGIILDAPCSGSGTWGRTPEMICQFEESKIQVFQNLQKSIANQIVKYLKPGKPLIYITCSVFSQENEEVVNYLVQEHGLKLETSEIIKGYEHKADTMFVARLTKS